MPDAPVAFSVSAGVGGADIARILPSPVNIKIRQPTMLIHAIAANNDRDGSAR